MFVVLENWIRREGGQELDLYIEDGFHGRDKPKGIFGWPTFFFLK